MSWPTVRNPSFARRPEMPLVLIAHSPFLLTLWAPRLIAGIGSTYAWVLISLTLLFLSGRLWPQDVGPFAKPLAGLLALPTLSLAAWLVFRVAYTGADSDEYFVLYFAFFTLALLPACIIAGPLGMAHPMWRVLLEANLAIATIVMVPLAIFEWITGTPLLAPSLIVEDGQARAAVGQLHPIILALMFALTAATTPLIRRRWLRWCSLILLTCGVMATNSQGQMFAIFVAIALSVSKRVRHFLARNAKAMVGCIVSALVMISCTYPRRSIPGDTLAELSSNYRGVLMAQIPVILAERPFGYGFGGIPFGKFVAESAWGAVDLSHSLDSELVVWAILTGFVGLAAYAWFTYVALKGLSRSYWMGSLLLFVLLVSGLTVALFAWINVAMLFALLIAVALDGSLPNGEAKPRSHRIRRRGAFRSGSTPTR